MKKSLQAIYEYWLDWKMGAKITSTLLNVTILSMVALVFTYYLINANQATKRVATEWEILGEQILLRNQEDVNNEVKKLETLSETSFLVVAVKRANYDRANWAPDLILAQDTAWRDNNPSMEPTVTNIASNSISRYLVDFRKSNPEEAEVFVTDIKGLNIAMTNRTSDFLQADEDWWKSTFNGGEGQVYFGSVEYDDSSKVYAMDIGVPIHDPDTNKTIGVLRGTLNISPMIDYLKNVNMGKSSDIVLLDSKGTVLYSHASSYLMRPAPDALLGLFESGQNIWHKTKDLDGNPAVVATISLKPGSNKPLGWRVLVTQNWSEMNQGVIQDLLISILIGILVTVTGIFLSGRIIRHSIVTPLDRLTKIAQELSIGNIIRDQDSLNEKLASRKDEVGEISRAFDRLTAYFLGAADASSAIADKNLSLVVTPNSECDELGNAFAKMITELNDIVGQFAESAETVLTAASQLANASDQSGKATNQIGNAIQQVALGTTQQSDDINKIASSVEQMGRAIEDVAKGAQEQSKAISTASQITTQINSSIEQVSNYAEFGTQGAAYAADVARAGAQTVEATIKGMQTIKQKVGLSVQKVREMGQRSEQIDNIVETIEDIAAQTNLLALNAAIEAARAEAKGEKTVENLLQQHMLGAVNLVAEILSSGRELNSQDLVALVRLARVPDLCIADSDGVVIASNQPGNLGFRFSETPGQQSSVFRPLLNRRDGIVIRPIVVRDQDTKPYIYVGVSRRDCSGIIQAGSPADLVYKLGGYSRGFAVVAKEVGKLAEHAKASTKEIAVLIRNLQKTVTEAAIVMEDGARDVELGSAQAMEAGESLSSILTVAETVTQQVKEIAASVQHMTVSSNELVSVMEVVSAVVEENTAATEEMAANSTELTQAITNIAGVSEENSATLEEVSSSTAEILAQVKQVTASAASLIQTAQDLQRNVAQFSLMESNRAD